MENILKGEVVLKKINDIINARLSLSYPEEDFDKEWFKLINKIKALKGKRGLIIEDHLEVDSVIFMESETTLSWIGVGQYKIPTILFLKNIARKQIFKN